MNHTTRAQRTNKRQDAMWEKALKLKRASELSALADHVYAASERVEDTMTAEDRKEQFGEQCVYCGKDSMTCEHYEPCD